MGKIGDIKIATLVVIALLGILALVAMATLRSTGAANNFLDTQNRAKVARVRSDMRSLASAIDQYHLRDGGLPAWTTDTQFTKLHAITTTGKPVPSFRLPSSTGATGLHTLTTPNAYISTYPRDAFTKAQDDPFAYFNKGKSYILLSPGPDHDYDYDLTQFTPGSSPPSEPILFATYDPTNGASSSGDVWEIEHL